MSNLEIFITNPFSISSTSFYPRNYNPDFLFVRDELQNNPTLAEYIKGDVKGGSTPPAYLFYKDKLTIRRKRLLQRINKIRYILKAGIHNWILAFLLTSTTAVLFWIKM